MPNSDPVLLTVNTGSSSLKAALYRIDAEPVRLVSCEAKQIGLEVGSFQVRRGEQKIVDQKVRVASHQEALGQFFGWLSNAGELQRIAAIGHRVVHGGTRNATPRRIDEELLAELRGLVPLAPNHLPQAIGAIEVCLRSLTGRLQVACFDTAFHRTLPRRAQMLPLPREFFSQGVMRYGFHGLSYEYLVDRLRTIDPQHTGGRAILAHLGNGCSMAAVKNGISVDTSMGFTPAGGLVMSSRSGDLDPGVLIYLAENYGLSSNALNQLVNQRSGLLGTSGLSGDMSRLLAIVGQNSDAAEAIELFCYQARKFVGAYAAALGGIDTLVFTGGIGENAAPIRQWICEGLEFLGLQLDLDLNRKAAEIISPEDSRVAVRVIKTDEDLMIARHTRRLLNEGVQHAGNQSTAYQK